MHPTGSSRSLPLFLSWQHGNFVPLHASNGKFPFVTFIRSIAIFACMHQTGSSRSLPFLSFQTLPVACIHGNFSFDTAGSIIRYLCSFHRDFRLYASNGKFPFVTFLPFIAIIVSTTSSCMHRTGTVHSNIVCFSSSTLIYGN